MRERKKPPPQNPAGSQAPGVRPPDKASDVAEEAQPPASSEAPKPTPHVNARRERAKPDVVSQPAPPPDEPVEKASPRPSRQARRKNRSIPAAPIAGVVVALVLLGGVLIFTLSTDGGNEPDDDAKPLDGAFPFETPKNLPKNRPTKPSAAKENAKQKDSTQQTPKQEPTEKPTKKPAGSNTWRVVKLKASDITNPRGDGPDGRGNSGDDTWQFWYEEVVHRDFHRLNSYYRHSFNGWSHNHNMETEIEGIWGEPKTGIIYIHPYAGRNDHRAIALTWTVPKTGVYTITGEVTDVMIDKPSGKADGIIWRIERATDGKRGKLLKRGGPVGDGVGPPSAKFSVENVKLKRGELLRLVVDPNGHSHHDMTKIDSFEIREVKVDR